MNIRLQRYLSRCGLGSRRSCESFVTQGVVEVDGVVISELGFVIDDTSEVRVDGVVMNPLPLRYFVMNKPPGIICVRSDPKGRRWAVDLIPGGNEMGLFPVGRLDLDTTGLLILTNDGEMGNRIAHPRYSVKKEYVAVARGIIDEERIMSLEGGVEIGGRTVSSVRIMDVSHKGGETRVVLTIKEGRYHIVKRLFLALGHRLSGLHRSAVGGLGVDGIPLGGYRELGRDELAEAIGIADQL